MEFTRDELGKPLSKQETVRAIFGGTLYPGSPLGLENQKMGGIFQSQKSRRKYWKTQGISDECYLLSFSDVIF